MNSDRKALWLAMVVVVLIILAGSIGDKYTSNFGTKHQSIITER